MAGVPAQSKFNIKDHVRAGTQAIRNGVVEKTEATRRKYWRAWSEYAKEAGISRYLTPPPKQLSQTERYVIRGFLECVRRGTFGHRRQVSAQTVRQAIRGIAKTTELDGRGPSPLHIDPKRYIAVVEEQVNCYSADDPPPDQKIAVPVSVPNWLYKLGLMATTNIEYHTAVGELTLIAFYFLLRVGEYTPPSQPRSSPPKGTKHKKRHKKRRTLTQQFKVQDITFWDKNHKIIPKRSKLSKLLKAEAASLRISNQKNGKKGATIYAEALHQECCPIRALANRRHHIPYL